MAAVSPRRRAADQGLSVPLQLRDELVPVEVPASLDLGGGPGLPLRGELGISPGLRRSVEERPVRGILGDPAQVGDEVVHRPQRAGGNAGQQVRFDRPSTSVDQAAQAVLVRRRGPPAPGPLAGEDVGQPGLSGERVQELLAGDRVRGQPGVPSRGQRVWWVRGAEGELVGLAGPLGPPLLVARQVAATEQVLGDVLGLGQRVADALARGGVLEVSGVADESPAGAGGRAVEAAHHRLRRADHRRDQLGGLEQARVQHRREVEERSGGSGPRGPRECRGSGPPVRRR